MPPPLALPTKNSPFGGALDSHMYGFPMRGYVDWMPLREAVVVGSSPCCCNFCCRIHRTQNYSAFPPCETLLPASHMTLLLHQLLCTSLLFSINSNTNRPYLTSLLLLLLQ